MVAQKSQLFEFSKDREIELDSKKIRRILFNFYLAASWPNLGHYPGNSLTHPMIITVSSILTQRS